MLDTSLDCLLKRRKAQECNIKLIIQQVMLSLFLVPLLLFRHGSSLLPVHATALVTPRFQSVDSLSTYCLWLSYSHVSGQTPNALWLRHVSLSLLAPVEQHLTDSLSLCSYDSDMNYSEGNRKAWLKRTSQDNRTHRKSEEKPCQQAGHKKKRIYPAAATKLIVSPKLAFPPEVQPGRKLLMACKKLIMTSQFPSITPVKMTLISESTFLSHAPQIYGN